MAPGIVLLLSTVFLGTTITGCVMATRFRLIARSNRKKIVVPWSDLLPEVSNPAAKPIDA